MIAAILLVDRFGRRTLLITSSISCGVSLMALGTYFYLDENACADDNPMCTSSISEELVKKLNWVPLVSLITFSFGFNIGLGPLPWMMNGEMYSEEAKSTSASLASATNWTTTFLVTKFSINITNAINNSGSYYLFGSVCLIASVFVFLVVPETKGKSVQEMKEYFEGHKKEKHGKNNLALADDTLPPYDPCMDDKNDKDGK
jgi:MFS family permease